MKKYQCPICGKNHDVYWGLEIEAPHILALMSEEERAERVKELAQGFFFVDEKDFFVNGVINIDMEGEKDACFSWNIFASISHKKFSEHLEQLKKGELIEFEGKLANELPFYQDALGLACKVLIQLTSEDIEIEIIIEEESQLKKDQIRPIKTDRVIELMEVFYHNKASAKKRFEKPFSKRFKEELTKVEKEYMKKDEDFVINISGQQSVLFQIISRRMLASNKDIDKGFGLHLSFDQSFEEETERIVKFRRTKYAEQFEYHEWDGIPTYQIDTGKDKKRLEKLIKGLIKEVYEQEVEGIELDKFKA